MSTVQAYFDGINDERYDDVGALFARRRRADRARDRAHGAGRRRSPSYFRAALRLYPKHYDDPTRGSSTRARP